jgi:hypothetical protein
VTDSTGAAGAAWLGVRSSGGGSTTAGSTSATGAATTGLMVFTNLGGGRTATGFTGSGAFLPGTGLLPLITGVSAKMSPVGRTILRCFASRSTNWRATTSSMVLDALFASMPWSRLSSAVTSWLVVPRSSATL